MRRLAFALVLAGAGAAVISNPAPAAAAEEVRPTLVQTIATSGFTPPSPDPSGIVYIAAQDRLLISDSEVDEMTLYQGSNLFTATRTGSGTGTGTTLAHSNREPSGLGFNPADGTLFESNDDANRIWLIKPGADGRYGTADDTTSSFSTTTFGSSDPEGVEYDTATGHLFICDGSGLRVYEINPVNGTFGDGNDTATSFGLGQHDAADCEGIGIDAQRGTLLAIDPSKRRIYELSKAGELLRTLLLDQTVIPTTGTNFASVTMAPSSTPLDSPTAMSYWLVDRHADNGADPNENDGLLYELSLGTGPPPDAPPSIAITAPGESAIVAGTTVVEASASDDVGVDRVTFAVDGTQIGTDQNGGDGWSVSWDTTAASDGAHTITATAVDTAEQSTGDSNQVTVDNTAPSVSVTSPTAGSTVSGVVSVSAAASDNDSVATVRFLVDGETIGTDADGTDGWGVSWDTASATAGQHTITAIATDRAGNGTTSDPVQVSVEAEPPPDAPPSIAITAPGESAIVAGTTVVEASASDDVGVDRVTFAVDGTQIGTDQNGGDGWSVSWDTTAASDGAHTITATAVDTAEQSTGDSNQVTVDNTAPSVSVTSPTAGSTVSGVVSVSAAASDNDSVATVRFLVDGETIGTDADGTDGWGVSWDTASATAGQHTITAIATDRAGNGTTSDPVAIDVVGDVVCASNADGDPNIPGRQCPDGFEYGNDNPNYSFSSGNVKVKLKAGTEFVFTSNVLNITCNRSVGNGRIADSGAGDGVPNGFLFDIDWQERSGGVNSEQCPTNIAEVTANGDPIETNSGPGIWDFEGAWLADGTAPNGTLTLLDVKASFNLPQAALTCFVEGDTDGDGTLNEGDRALVLDLDNPGNVDVEEELVESSPQSASCPDTAHFSADYVLKGNTDDDGNPKFNDNLFIREDDA